jgi:predicted nucleic acid-binding protein
MSAVESVFFDTNILVYAHDAGDKCKREKARSLIFDGMRDGTGVISAQVLGEFYVTVTRKIAEPLAPDEARRELLLLSRLKTVEIDAVLVLKATDIQAASQTSYWDALILAAAERAQCKEVLSEDLSSERIYGSVRVVNPF